MASEHYKFNQNRQCEFFPCHKGIAQEDFNCLFCYCPLYALGPACGGSYSYDNEWGIKDCSDCLLPHKRDNYDYVVEKVGDIIEMVKLPPEEEL